MLRRIVMPFIASLAAIGVILIATDSVNPQAAAVRVIVKPAARHSPAPATSPSRAGAVRISGTRRPLSPANSEQIVSGFGRATAHPGDSIGIRFDKLSELRASGLRPLNYYIIRRVEIRYGKRRIYPATVVATLAAIRELESGRHKLKIGTAHLSDASIKKRRLNASVRALGMTTYVWLPREQFAELVAEIAASGNGSGGGRGGSPPKGVGPPAGWPSGAKAGCGEDKCCGETELCYDLSGRTASVGISCGPVNVDVSTDGTFGAGLEFAAR